MKLSTIFLSALLLGCTAQTAAAMQADPDPTGQLHIPANILFARRMLHEVRIPLGSFLATIGFSFVNQQVARATAVAFVTSSLVILAHRI